MLLDNKIVENIKKWIKPASLFYAIVVSFLVANFPVMKFADLFNINRDTAVLVRGFIFLTAVIILLYFSFKNIREIKKFFSWDIFLRSVVLMVFLMILVSTLRASYMGEVYANISLSPFDQDVGFFYRRILEPALAYFLQLKGQFLYTIFHFLITFSCIYLIILWLERKLFVKFKFWQLLSIMTSGIIIQQFEAPGYPDPLIFLLALITFFIPLNIYGRISILTLMFLSHESAALFLGLIFAWFYFPKEERKFYFMLPFFFYFLWFANYNFNFTNLFLGHLSLTDGNALTLFLKNINMILLPIFFAYKFLWIFVVLSFYYLFKDKNYKLLTQIAALVLIPISLIMIPDTSRVIAWGSIGMFLALAYIYKKIECRLFNFVLLINLLLPSMAAGIDTGGPVSYVGLYGFIVHLIKPLVRHWF